MAESVLAPSWSEMLYFDEWVQSTPALVLFGIRASTAVLGISELAFRLVPLAAGLLSLVLTGILLQRIFPLPVAWLGATFQALNYWGIKYSQQAKQYSVDVLTSSTFLLLLWNLNESPQSRNRFRVLLAFGCIAPFLSHPTVFWIPAALAMLAFDRRHWQWPRRTLTATALWTVAVGVNYFAFIAPNRSARFLGTWDEFMLLNHGFLAGLAELGDSLMTLFLPPLTPALRWVSGTILALVIIGLGVALARIGQRRENRFAAITCGTPLLTAVLGSYAGVYPVLDYPRIILWFLPCAALLICLALQVWSPLWTRIPWKPVAAACIVMALAVPWLMGRVRPTEEQNRAAFTYVKTNAAPSDTIYVNGGLWAQFTIYERILDWSPPRRLIGSWGFPCCALANESKTAWPDSEGYEDDAAGLLDVAKERIWVLAPAGGASHWSGGFTGRLEKFRLKLQEQGCENTETRDYGYTRLDVFDCQSALPR